MPTITFRDATIDDLELLIHWDQQPHVKASDPDTDWEWEYELPRKFPWREQLIFELDGRPLGILQIIDPYEEETHYWGEVEPNLRAIDIWIGEAEHLGKGYGTEMMRQAINRCFEDEKVSKILIDPLEINVKAHRFYQRLGFRVVGKREFEGDQCLVHELSREDWFQSRLN